MNRNNLRIGTIVRIRLKNFVSYNELDFSPTPELNLLIAPNGAGKSSLLSAIVLGLGGKPGTIGRSNKIGDYVLFGSTSAKIEIELFNPEGRNYIIGLKIKNDGTSKHYLNSSETSLGKIRSLMKMFNIQVDNLCQVLPQDRVSDFLKMNRQELLINTLKTVGDSSLSTSFDRLRELRSSLTTSMSDLDNMKSNHNDEVKKCERMQGHVETIIERRGIVKTLNFCQQKIAWTSYQLQEDEHTKVNGYLNEVMKKYKQILKEIEPEKAAIREIERGKEPIKQKIKKKEDELSQMKASIRQVVRLTNSTPGRIREVEDDLKRKQEEQKELIEHRKDLEQRIGELDKSLQDFSEDHITQKIEESNSKVNKLMMTINDLENRENEFKNDFIQANSSLRDIERRLDEASLGERQKLKMLSNLKDVHAAYDLIKGKTFDFSSNVYGPIFMELSTDNPNNGKYIEMIVNFNDLVVFIAETPDDTTNLCIKLRDERHLKIGAAHCEAPTSSLSQLFKPKISLEQIRQLGFQNYIISLIDGPPTVLKYLCRSYNLHNIPYGFGNIDTNQLPNSLRKFFIDDDLYKVSFSKYTKQRYVQVSAIQKARFLSTSVDKRIITMLSQEITKKNEEIDGLKEQLAGVQKGLRAMESELNRERYKKKEVARLNEQFKITVVRKRRYEEDLANLEASAIDEEAERANAELKVKDLLSNLVKEQTNLLARGKKYSKLTIGLTLLEVEHALLSAKVEAKKRELVEKEEAEAKCEEDIKELKIAIKQAKSKMMKLHDEAKELTDGLSMTDPAFRRRFTGAFKKLPDSLEELKAKLNDFKARAEYLNNPMEEKMLTEYEESKEAAEKLASSISQLEEELKAKQTEFSDLKTSWVANTEQVISVIDAKFSEFFVTIKCLGQVQLNKGNDPEAVENYGLDIKVKFRDNQELEVCNSSTLSGGEKTLTTAVFLLSLQSLTNSPFRCVDEINQHMDPFNERSLYDLLFNSIASSSVQYFLLSPKILNGVTYPDFCTVHNIVNSSSVHINP